MDGQCLTLYTGILEKATPGRNLGVENSVTLFRRAIALHFSPRFYRNPMSLPPIFADMPLVGHCCTTRPLFL